MNIDCHVHTCAFTPGHGMMSDRLRRSLPFRFIDHTFKLGEPGRGAESRLEGLLREHVEEAAPELDAAVVLAFDAVYRKDGSRDDANTHLEVTNDYARQLCGRNPRLLFGASVHPYRKDAIAELERCVADGAVLLKWLPITQGIDPSDPACFGFYDALAHHGVPLLSHTGGERTLPQVNRYADPALLMPAVRRGVKVICAHCGSRSVPWETDYVNRFVQMAIEYEHVYGDTAALNLPTRMHAYKTVLEDDRVRAKLLHGSDFPILPLPPLRRLGREASVRLMEEKNWLLRDVRIKRELGLGDDYFGRAAGVLRMSEAKAHNDARTEDARTEDARTEDLRTEDLRTEQRR